MLEKDANNFVQKTVRLFINGLSGWLIVSVVVKNFFSMVVAGVGGVLIVLRLLGKKQSNVIKLKSVRLNIQGWEVAGRNGAQTTINGKVEKKLGPSTQAITDFAVLEFGKRSVWCVDHFLKLKSITSTVIPMTITSKIWCLCVMIIIGMCMTVRSSLLDGSCNDFSNCGKMAEIKSLKKSGTLEWESEVKDGSQSPASRNDYGLNLLRQNIMFARGSESQMTQKIVWTGFNNKIQKDRIKSRFDNNSIPYQRGAKAIAREIVKSTKGKVRCDKDIAQGYINDWYGDYVEVEAYVDMCKESVLDPAYLFNPFGRTRRFFAGADQAVIAAQQREAVNMPIQSSVADTLNTAVCNLIEWRMMNPGEAVYDILLAIHDAVLFEVPGEYVNVMINRVIPECMSYGVQVPSWQPVPNWIPTQPFNLDTDIEVMTRWGEKARPDDLRARHVPDSYLDAHFKKAA